ncbi:hypothetical protein OURE66S_02635 [Oligella ureolytica]
MKRLTVLGALVLSCASVSSHAQSSDTLSGTTRLACEAILCLSSSLQPGQCKPSLNHYFDIRKYRKGSFSWGRTVVQRAFLDMCPVSSAPDMKMSAFDVWILELKTRGRNRNKAFWGGSSYAPTTLTRRTRRSHLE